MVRGAEAGPLFHPIENGETMIRKPMASMVPRYAFRQALELVGLEGTDLSFEALRRGMIDSAIQAGVPLPVLCQFAGLKSVHSLDHVAALGEITEEAQPVAL